jgi:preprotein translocase subunit SecD
VSPRQVPNGLTLTYAIEPYGGPVTQAKLKQTVEVIHARLKGLGVKGAVQASQDRLMVTLPRPVAESAGEAVRRTAQLYFYDWEPNVIGVDGKPAPTELVVTGGPRAGEARFGLPEYNAVLRAAKRSPILRRSDTTWSSGCTPQQVGGCSFGTWYLLDTKHEKVLRGPEETKSGLYAENYKPPAVAVVKAVRVNPGTVLVQARPVENAAGKVTQSSPDSWYVVNDNPVLTGADLTHPGPGFEEGAGGTREPNVSFGFTSSAKRTFERVTREVAHRGQEAQLPGVPKEAAEQHFAVVLDGQLITNPSIDYTLYPEGIDATNGSQISGGFTIISAQNLANELRSGALPVRLALLSRARG